MDGPVPGKRRVILVPCHAVNKLDDPVAKSKNPIYIYSNVSNNGLPYKQLEYVRIMGHDQVAKNL